MIEMPTEEIDEKDWNLEEWKQKYPMDYYKALRILSEASNGVVATKIFKTIYQITRLHVPDVLFKYYSLSNDEELNKKKFQSVKAKFVYFYLLPDLIEQPIAVLFDNKRVNPRVKIESEILFYNKYENAVIHLGIDKNEKEDLYYPRTFFVEKLGKDNVEDIYTVNQIKITVEKEKRIICI